MNERLKERIAEEWAMLDPVDPLRRLLSDVIDVLAQTSTECEKQPAQEPDVEPACPVCHATPIFSLDRRVNEWSGQCKHCGVEGSPATTEAEAKQKWIVWHNKRRTPPAAQPAQEPRNFCPRCGKRTADLTVIHTCTPPEGGHQ
jgi:transcription elongation factor Elf1